jgi:peptide-methionine (S)-S-oxide reductase
VISTTSGYINGTVKNPSYKQVSSGGTGHAEAVEIVYDPAKVTFAKLLDVFWRNIDPLVKDKQFCDSGDMYRTAVFYLDDEQKKLAEETKKTVEAKFAPREGLYRDHEGDTFYTAEDYHQDYYKKNEARYNFYRWNCGRDPASSSSSGARRSSHDYATHHASRHAPPSLAGIAAMRWSATDAAPAAKFEIEKSDAEWRQLLTPAQYDVLRKHGTERAGTSPLNAEKRKGTFACAGCDLPLFSSDTKYRERHRLAELLAAAAERGRHHDRQVVLHDAHRGALPPLRRPSRARVRGRPEADRPALLHERRGAEVHAGARERAGVTAVRPIHLLPAYAGWQSRFPRQILPHRHSAPAPGRRSITH